MDDFWIEETFLPDASYEPDSLHCGSTIESRRAKALRHVVGLSANYAVVAGETSAAWSCQSHLHWYVSCNDLQSRSSPS